MEHPSSRSILLWVRTKERRVYLTITELERNNIPTLNADIRLSSRPMDHSVLRYRSRYPLILDQPSLLELITRTHIIHTHTHTHSYPTYTHIIHAHREDGKWARWSIDGECRGWNPLPLPKNPQVTVLALDVDWFPSLAKAAGSNEVFAIGGSDGTQQSAELFVTLTREMLHLRERESTGEGI